MNTSHDPMSEPQYALQLFEPDPQTVYTIEATAHLVDVPRRMVLVYYKLGLVSPVVTRGAADTILTTRPSVSSGASNICAMSAALTCPALKRFSTW